MSDTIVIEEKHNSPIIDDEENFKRLMAIKIIKEENKRMNKQVERVLQMSLLDKSDLDLNLKEQDIHALIENAGTLQQKQQLIGAGHEPPVQHSDSKLSEKVV